jgi:hypothetical protein
MPSPFPGMNPYLEQKRVWRGFHDRFVLALSDALAPQVNPHFIVEIEEYLFIHEPSAEERLRVGDSDVSLSRVFPPATAPLASEQIALAAPRQIRISTEMEIERHRYLEVRTIDDREIIAVIEVLSPTNKLPSKDRDQYLGKRHAILQSRAHFIEIDLLRDGPKMPAEDQPECDYGVLVSSSQGRPNAGYWPIMLRDPLPTIPIPLRDPLPSAHLDLQAILHSVYDRAFYKNHIYRSMPEPPLADADCVWAEEIVKRASQ